MQNKKRCGMSEAGKRPTKPGQMVMIVGFGPEWKCSADNGIIAITEKLLQVGTHLFGDGVVLRVLSPYWQLTQCSRSTIFSKDFLTLNIAPAAKLIVIADPDIDVSETESLGLPEGVAV